MAIKRKRLDRKAELTERNGVLVDLPPGWRFTINCPHHGEQTFDFTPYRSNGREQLAEEVRDAIWSMRHELVGVTLARYQRDACDPLWRYLAERREATSHGITRLSQIDLAFLQEYLAWLAVQVGHSGPYVGKPWSNGTQRRIYGALKSVLVNRLKRNPQVLHPQLSFPRNPFPNSNRLGNRRERYSKTEHQRILRALSADLHEIHSSEGAKTITPLGVLAVHLVILAASVGRNKQSLLELRRDSFSPHPLPDRELMVTTKRRGWSTHATSLRSGTPPTDTESTVRAIPATVADHFRYLCEYTAPFALQAADADKDLAFIYPTGAKEKGRTLRLSPQIAGAAVRALGDRHNLLDDRGQPLRLNIARMRPTFGAELYERTRDIRVVQRALGHVSVKTTADHYAEPAPEADRDHAIVVEGMVSRFTRTEVDGRVFLAADGKLPLENMKDLLEGGYSTGIARCKNPFREGEEVCQKFFYCFRCPNMCVFEDDLWRLFSFYYRLLAERSKLSTLHWEKTYGPIVRRIDVDIAPQFPTEVIDAAKLQARQNPVAVLPNGERIVVSHLRDAVWDFYPYIEQENVAPHAKRAHWDVALPDGSRLTDPKHGALLAAAQDFVWSLFADPIPGRKPIVHRTLIAKVTDIVVLIRWMIGLGVHRFRDLGDVIASYPAAARLTGDGAALSVQQVTRRLGIVEDLYTQRDKLGDALTSHPWVGETAGSLAGRGRRGSRRDKPRTPYIPDEVAVALARAALELVQVRGPALLALRDEIEHARLAAERDGADARRQDKVRTVVARRAGYTGQRAVAGELKRLRTACYIVIDFFSGVRDSEMMSLAMNCIARTKSRDGTLDLLWLHGTIYKTGKRAHAWIVPPPVQEAVATLEKLAAPLFAELHLEERRLKREAKNADLPANRLEKLHRRLEEVRRSKDKLFACRGPAKGAPIAVLSNNAMNSHLKEFCAYFNIGDEHGRPYRLRTHQFRRTYARYVAKSELGDLLRLQSHFGHWSFDMTAYYAEGGSDEYEADTELIAMVLEEKNTRQGEILSGYLDSDDAVANGGHWLYEWRKNVRTAPNKETLIAQYAGTISLNGTGHSWCVGNVKGVGCGGLCVFEAQMCVDCRYGIIGQEHRPVWEGIRDQQMEALALDDIGPGGKARAQKILIKAEKVLHRLDNQSERP